jgi:GNAT superfamily N-acetyltransferase
LLSRDDEPHHIHWLAVRQSARGRGVGRALLGAIVDRWPTGDISVTTFTADESAGLAARRLYTSSGFTCEGPSQPGPDGGARDLFVLRRDTW